MGSRLNFVVRQAVMQALQSFFSKSNGFQKLDLTKFDLINGPVVEDLTWLKENFEISYPLPNREKQEGLVFEDYPSTECISEFFGRYSLNFDTSLSLVDNLENFYMNFFTLFRNRLSKK